MNILASLLMFFALYLAVTLDGTEYSLPAWCIVGLLIGIATTLINRARGGAR